MECWLGGQLSALAFLWVTLAIVWEVRGRSILSGAALGMCLYKPTLIILLLPMLIVARRWWNLLGVGLSALFLSLLSLMTVGPKISSSYIDALLGFTGTTTGTGMVRKDFKFIDLNFFFRNLFGGPTVAGKVLVLVIAAIPLIYLFIAWWRLGSLLGGKSETRNSKSEGETRTDEAEIGNANCNMHSDRENTATIQGLLWASTITWTMTINVYMGIYDMILIVPGLLWMADVFYREKNHLDEYFPLFKLLVFLLVILSWITQPVARITGFQMITLVLVALAALQLRLAWKLLYDVKESLPKSSALASP
jgi:hypothetical protein